MHAGLLSEPNSWVDTVSGAMPRPASGRATAPVAVDPGPKPFIKLKVDIGLVCIKCRCVWSCKLQPLSATTTSGVFRLQGHLPPPLPHCGAQSTAA